MSNRLAIVFGGTRGIGAACVHTLADSGYDVAYTWVTSAPNLPERIGASRAKGYQADVTDAAQVARAFDDAVRDFGPAVHCVVANAGINVPPSPLAQCDPAVFRRVVEVNLVGAFNMLAEAARRIADGGSIIALTTSMVRMAVPNAGPYVATKAAVECLIRSLSKELAARKVRVNAVAPGPVDTDLYRAGKTDEMKARSAALSPFNRVGMPQEVAEVVAFIASEKASWVHGQIVQPNGGMV